MNLTFEYLLSLCPEPLFKRIDALKGVDQRKDHHPEGNVFNHTKIVVTRLSKYQDINLSLAGLFHDIGKDVTTKPGKNGYLQAIGHEDVSAQLVLDHGHELLMEELFKVEMLWDPGTVYQIVKNHMRIKLFDEMKLSKQMEMRRLASFGLLQLFTIADSMKTLTEEELNSV